MPPQGALSVTAATDATTGSSRSPLCAPHPLATGVQGDGGGSARGLGFVQRLQLPYCVRPKESMIGQRIISQCAEPYFLGMKIAPSTYWINSFGVAILACVVVRQQQPQMAWSRFDESFPLPGA